MHTPPAASEVQYESSQSPKQLTMNKVGLQPQENFLPSIKPRPEGWTDPDAASLKIQSAL